MFDNQLVMVRQSVTKKAVTFCNGFFL